MYCDSDMNLLIDRLFSILNEKYTNIIKTEPVLFEDLSNKQFGCGFVQGLNTEKQKLIKMFDLFDCVKLIRKYEELINKLNNNSGIYKFCKLINIIDDESKEELKDDLENLLVQITILENELYRFGITKQYLTSIGIKINSKNSKKEIVIYDRINYIYFSKLVSDVTTYWEVVDLYIKSINSDNLFIYDNLKILRNVLHEYSLVPDVTTNELSEYIKYVQLHPFEKNVRYSPNVKYCYNCKHCNRRVPNTSICPNCGKLQY